MEAPGKLGVLPKIEILKNESSVRIPNTIPHAWLVWHCHSRYTAERTIREEGGRSGTRIITFGRDLTHSSLSQVVDHTWCGAKEPMTEKAEDSRNLCICGRHDGSSESRDRLVRIVKTTRYAHALRMDVAAMSLRKVDGEAIFTDRKVVVAFFRLLRDALIQTMTTQQIRKNLGTS